MPTATSTQPVPLPAGAVFSGAGRKSSSLVSE